MDKIYKMTIPEDFDPIAKAVFKAWEEDGSWLFFNSTSSEWIWTDESLELEEAVSTELGADILVWDVHKGQPVVEHYDSIVCGGPRFRGTLEEFEDFLVEIFKEHLDDRAEYQFLKYIAAEVSDDCQNW